MCRLVAYAGSPLPLHPLVFGGEHPLYRQSWAPRELLSGSLNVDGWGVAWPGPDGALVRMARLEPIWHDPDLPGLLRAVSAPRALAALRNATPGLPVDRTGLLPLVRGEWALAMNGYVPAFRERHMRALRAPLSDAGYAALQGVGDAETLFLRLLQEVEGGASPAEALVRVRDAVAERLEPGETAPLTLVLLGPGGITALHTTVNGAVNSLYLCRNRPLAPEGALLASEALDPEGWERVPDHSLVELRDGEAEVRPL